MQARSRLALVLVTGLGLASQAAADDFASLVKGPDPKQFELVGIGPDTIKITDGEVEISGTPNGYFATKKDYKNYVLKFDWQYPKPEDATKGNSGLLVHITGAHKVWPKCTEVQLYNVDAGNIFAIQGAKFQGKKDAAAQKKAIKPPGDWNEEEVTCQDGKITCKLNGIEVCTGTGADPDHGPIGWQSEGSLIKFRNIKINELP